MDLKETSVLGENINQHWYYRSKANAMTRLLQGAKVRTVLDVGAGSGFFSRYLLAEELAQEAWCVDNNYADDFESTETGKPIHFRRSVGSVKADLVLLMDVLEHVDDDVALLNDYVSKVPPSTIFLISVPAFQCLWSEHDVFLEHKRRYTLRQIEHVAERAGLNVRCGTYYFLLTFPIAAGIRVLGKMLRKSTQEPRSQLQPHSPLVNITLAALSRAELPLLPHNRIAGLTAFCLAETR